MPRTVNPICGPSKTGDVEHVILEGAHGLRRLHVVVVWEWPARRCHNRPMRFFDTEGPVRPDAHYAIPSLDRMDVEELPAPGRADGADAGLSVASVDVGRKTR